MSCPVVCKNLYPSSLLSSSPLVTFQMSTSRTLALSSLAIQKTLKSPLPPFHHIASFAPPSLHFPFRRQRSTSALHGHSPSGAPFSTSLAFDSSIDSEEDTVEQILSKPDRIERLMKMQRRSEAVQEEPVTGNCSRRWFPYLDLFRSGNVEVGLVVGANLACTGMV